MILPHLIAWTFNLLLTGGDLIVLLLAKRYRRVVVVVGGITGLGITGCLLAAILSQEVFLGMRLVAYLLFAHLPVVLSGCAWLLRKQRRFASLGFGLLAGLLLTVAVDAFVIEPQWLEVTRVRLTSPKIERPLTIAILADIQTDRFGDHERRAIRTCLANNPDMILMAGDYLQVATTSQWTRLQQEFNAFLKEVDFSAPEGIYAVQGNTDHPRWFEIFTGLPVHLIRETGSLDAGRVRITGLEVMDSFNRRLSLEPQSGPVDSRLHIVLGHAPDFALSDVSADLLIAGHTHGGQVRIPGVGPLMTASQVPRAWAQGITRLDKTRTLIVSRGIGMERLNAPRLRFLCRPELVLIEIVPVESPPPLATGN